ncbi:hypothetical protein vseg_018226 [Gypsophila vaccaria]
MSPATPPTTAAATAAAAAATITNIETKRRHEPPQSRHTPATPREECWSEDETDALIDAWGALHLSLNRGILRQHQWSDVAAAVNSAVESDVILRRSRTGVQCKNRIDTLKRRYKAEKAKLAGDDRFVSSWRFFSRLDFLISGDKSPPEAAKSSSPAAETSVVAPVRWPVKRRSAMRTRPARWLTEEREESEERGVDGGGGGVGGGGGRGGGGGGGGWRMVAEAIKRVGEVYERVEKTKQRQMMELERERLKFAMDLEYQRINFLVDAQLHLLSSYKRSKLDCDRGRGRDHNQLDSYHLG